MSLRLNPSSLIDELCASLRQRILEGEIAPAARLTENGVADQYGVSRPTAKAALERLVHQGLLRRDANKTARVPTLNADEIRDIYFSRICLERQVAAELAVRGHVPGKADRALQELKAITRADDSVTRLVEFDVAFHRSLTSAVGSPRLIRMHEAVMGEAHLCMAQVQVHQLLNPRVICREHAGLLRAIRDRDSAQAAERLTKHLIRACEALAGYAEAQSPDATG